ncbi:MAG: Sigma-70 family RNA polymerase sigma factor [Synergistales bacterium 54_9]|nr:MAG: Sigma-70 family RNA polymerase sigma factor [Synergistales bacterium 54_9]
MPGRECEDVLKKFRPLVEATARRFADNGADFDDLVQEGYLAIMELLPRCRNKKFLPKFLKLRVTARVKARASKWWRPFKRSDEFDPERHSPAYLEELPWTRWVAEGVLPERDCRIVRLLEAGFTQQEIAEDLGLTQQAVSFRVGRIREKLKKT